METEKISNVKESESPPENMETSEENHKPDSLKASTEKIVENAVSIDVITCADPPEEKRSQLEIAENVKKENIFARYFRRKTKGMSRMQIAILCIFPFVEFFAATVISIQGPFYPKAARGKGATPSESGIVFGSFELIVFLLAPVYGAKMGVWNPNRIFNYGIFTTSLSCIAFGFVHYIDGRIPFVIMSLVIRSIEAVGDAAFVVASFSIIAATFPESVATTFALMETFYGLGLIAGPTVGGGLFKLGGFTLPFVVMGCLLFIFAIATYFFITRESSAPDPDKVVVSLSFDMFKMFKISEIALTAFGTFAAATGIGFLNNNLQHHLEPFGVDEWELGLIFMLNGGVYALTAPFWGKLCDKTSQQLKIYPLIGAVLTIIGWSLVGPIPFIPGWKPSILLVCIGLVIFGLGLGAILVSAFIQFLHDAIANGRPDDVTTHGLVSGLWVSMTALGFGLGPVIGGFLDHHVGFRWGTLFILLEEFVLIGLLAYFFLRDRKAKQEEPSPEADETMHDVVITYAIKTDTPKPRKMKAKMAQIREKEAQKAASSNSDNENKENTTSDDKSGFENPTYVKET